MEKFEPKKEKRKSMFCNSAEQLIPELKKEGWEYDWSFHSRFSDQWNDACDRVERIQKGGFWEVILVQGQDELEKKDGVAYLYKRKNKKYEQYEKNLGYRK